MKKIAVLALFLSSMALQAFSQKIAGKLKPDQGQVFDITMDMTIAFAQQAMGYAIDFHVNGSAAHQYKVTNVTDDNSTMHHTMKRLSFQFDGMSIKMNFDSDNPGDMEGKLGKPVREMLEKQYDMIIDPNGKVLMVQPEKMTMPSIDDRMRIVTDMLKELTGVVQPPKKGEGSFFRVLPENEAAIGESWSETGITENGDYAYTYTLAEISDSTVLVNFNGTSTATSKADVMGSEAITTMNNKITGTIVVDKASGIVKQKKFNTESNGSTQVMGNSLPLTSRMTTVINVKKGE